MRMLMNITIPHEPFNTAVREGTAGSTLKRITEALRPEAIYFTEQNGHRGAVAVVDIAQPSDIPSLAEPWFLSFQADVKFQIVMTPEELAKAGLDKLGRVWA